MRRIGSRPNIFETSPHVINAVMGAIGGLGYALGPNKILLYVIVTSPSPSPSPSVMGVFVL